MFLLTSCMFFPDQGSPGIRGEVWRSLGERAGQTPVCLQDVDGKGKGAPQTTAWESLLSASTEGPPQTPASLAISARFPLELWMWGPADHPESSRDGSRLPLTTYSTLIRGTSLCVRCVSSTANKAPEWMVLRSLVFILSGSTQIKASWFGENTAKLWDHQGYQNNQWCPHKGLAALLYWAGSEPASSGWCFVWVLLRYPFFIVVNYLWFKSYGSSFI